MDGHLGTMERFLDAERGRSCRRISPAPTPAWRRPPRPLLGTIVSLRARRELVARRVLDPAEDRLPARPHASAARLATDPDAAALALMPLTMSLEILAEAAACLVPGLLVDRRCGTCARIAGSRGTTRRRRSRSRRGGSSPRTSSAVRVHVELRRTLDETGARAGARRSRRRAARRRAIPTPPPPLEPSTRATAARRAGRPGELYDGRDVPRPLLAGRARDRRDWRRRRRWPGSRCCRGRASCAATPRPRFVLDPVVLDAAGQLVGFWAAEQLERGRVVFPFRLAALDLYGPPPGRGSRSTCTRGDRARRRRSCVRSDIDVVDADGQPLDAAHGLGGQALRRARRLRPLAARPSSAPMSADWPAPLDARGGPCRSPAGACRRAASRRPRASGSRSGPSRVLGRRERELFARAQAAAEPAGSSGWAPAPRPRRPCGAAASGAAASSSAGGHRDPARTRDGRPWSRRPALSGSAAAPLVSLAHARARRRAVALAGAGAGRRRDRHRAAAAAARAGFAEAALRAGRARACSTACCPSCREEWVAALLVRQGGGGQGARHRPGARAPARRRIVERRRRAADPSSGVLAEVARAAERQPLVDLPRRGRPRRRDDAAARRRRQRR